MGREHVALPGSNRPKKDAAKRVADVDPKSEIEVTLSLRGPSLPESGAISAVALTRDEYASTYGASREDADKVSRTLEAYGLKVEDVSLAAKSIRVSGPVAAMEAAFRPKLGIYKSKTEGEFRGRSGDLQVPAQLDGIVTGIFGLDERRVARRKAKARRTSSRSKKRPARRSRKAATAPKRKLAPLTPADLEKRYNFPPANGKSPQIGIAEFDGGYFPNDLQTFCTKHGLPMPSVTVVPVGQTPPTLAQILAMPTQVQREQLDASGEVNMDIQIVAGLCPSAQIFVYFAPFTQKGWVDLLNQVIAGNPAHPVTLSISWGLAEDSPDWSDAARTEINDRLQAVAMLGVTVCISSGDDGSGDEMDDGRAHVDFPSSSSFALSVGGTMFTAANPAEVTWWQSPGRRTKNGGGATGGGVSVFFKRPPWQNVKIASLNKGSIDGRVIPDVAALAGPPFYDLTFLGKDAPNGGTSASAPLWASLVARISAILPANKSHRFLTPLLYQNAANGKPRGASSCRDITAGNNTSNPQPGVGYKAQAGFDAVTGWGIPDGSSLLAVL